MRGLYRFRVLPHGEMVEWFKAPVLKTGEVQASGGSNPSLSANILSSFGENCAYLQGFPCYYCLKPHYFLRNNVSFRWVSLRLVAVETATKLQPERE